MKKNDLFIKLMSYVTANSVLFASCSPQADISSEDVLNFKRANFAANTQSVDDVYDILNNLKPEQQELTKNTVELISALNSNASLREELLLSPELVFERYNLDNPLFLKNKTIIAQLLSFSDVEANLCLQNKDFAGYIKRLKETGIIEDKKEYSLSSLSSLESLQTRIATNPGGPDGPVVDTIVFICAVLVLVYVAAGTIAVVALCFESETAVHFHSAGYTYTTVKGTKVATDIDLNDNNTYHALKDFTKNDLIDAIDNMDDVSELDKAVVKRSLTDAQFSLLSQDFSE